MTAEEFVAQLDRENQGRLSLLAPDDTLKPVTKETLTHAGAAAPSERRNHGMAAEEFVAQLDRENQRRLSLLAPDDTLKPVTKETLTQELPRLLREGVMV
jgi:hypothetical protein